MNNTTITDTNQNNMTATNATSAIFNFDLKEETYELYNDETQNENDRWTILSKAVGNAYLADNPRSFILFEFFFQNVHFCHDSGFSFKQAQLYMTVVRDVFQRCMVGDTEGTMPSADKAVKLFYETFTTALRTSNDDVNGESSTLYSIKQVESVAAFFSVTFAQHVKGFQYVCYEIQPEVMEYRMIAIQTPLVPRSLTEGVMEKKVLPTLLVDLPEDALTDGLAALHVMEPNKSPSSTVASSKSGTANSKKR